MLNVANANALPFSNKSYPIALGISALMIALVLALVYIATSLPINNNEALIVREVSTASLPPPVVVPKITKPISNAQIALQVQGSGAQIELSEIVPITVANFDLNKDASSFAQALNIVVPDIDFKGFALSELDGIPRLLSSAKINVPQELKRQASSTVLIRLEVSINEQGRVSLINILTNPYPSLNFEITEMVNRVRFTSPVKQGEIVKARFIWPLEVLL
jgi:protein TonB